MMTCVSERSGIASSGIFRIAQTDATRANATKIRTRNLLWAENSMSFSMTPPCRRLGDWPASAVPSSLAFGSGGPPGVKLGRSLAMLVSSTPNAFQGRFEAALRIDQEVAAGHDQLTLCDTALNFVKAIRLDAHGHVPRLKHSLPLIDKHDLLGPGVKHGGLRNREDLARRDRNRGVHVHLGLQDILRVGQDGPHAGRSRRRIKHRVDGADRAFQCLARNGGGLNS